MHDPHNRLTQNSLTDPAALTTAGIYYSMLETSFGLLACCLPVLWKVLKGEGVQSIVNSVRDIISLGSLSPNRSPRRHAERMDSQASESNIVPSTRAYGAAVSDVELERLPSDGIVVTKTYETQQGNRMSETS